MISIIFKLVPVLLLTIVHACSSPKSNATEIEKPQNSQQDILDPASSPIVLGAERWSEYLPWIQDKKVALVVNHTSRVGERHLVDIFIENGIKVEKIFAPEHGFRGKADAGAKIEDGRDQKTGIEVISLYGKNKKPSPEHIQGIETIVFDIQDVGARFYTYISTMHYVMEAAAENDIPIIILDRPNPNAHIIDGPILEKEFSSFVGMHPIPIVHGLTVGELAKMINGEAWLKGGKRANLRVVSNLNYHHSKPYDLPIAPSPNLPNQRSIYLYPSLCLFEGTSVSVGRGTNKQFQIYGHPRSKVGDFTFTPQPMSGAAHPKQKGVECRGYDLSNKDLEVVREEGFNLKYLLDFYQSFEDKTSFFNDNNFFNKLAGTAQLKEDIINGKSEAEIRASWQAGLENYKALRKKYLLYP